MAMKRMFSSIDTYIYTMLAAFGGRLMLLAQEVRLGNQKAIRLAVITVELPIALGMGMIGAGVSSFFGLGEAESYAVVAAMSYLGPQGLEEIVREIFNRYPIRKRRSGKNDSGQGGDE